MGFTVENLRGFRWPCRDLGSDLGCRVWLMALMSLTMLARTIGSTLNPKP